MELSENSETTAYATYSESNEICFAKSVNIPQKPSQVVLTFLYADDSFLDEILVDKDVPDLEDWEDYADRRWVSYDDNRGSKPPIIRIRMRDKTGRPYLSDLHYSL
jgi:hypothetical protein